VLFKHALHAGLRDGSVTLTFRAWSRPQARAGGLYRLDQETALAVDSIDRVHLRDISERDARRAGYDSREALLGDLRAWSRAPLRAGSQVYRIAFHQVASEDPRTQLAKNASLSSDDIEAIAQRLDRMDGRSTHGPWTRQTLRLIAKRPAVRAPDLAAQLGRETLPFKADVRKLKALGLTISLDVGYQLSPRGEAFLGSFAQ
jgi:hypothetical protein